MAGKIKNFRQKTKPLIFTKIDTLLIKDKVIKRSLSESDVSSAEKKIYEIVYRLAGERDVSDEISEISKSIDTMLQAYCEQSVIAGFIFNLTNMAEDDAGKSTK